MIINVTAANQMTGVAIVPANKKLELQIGVYGAGAGTIEVQTTRAGNARTVASYAANSDPDDLVTVLGPCSVAVGIPNGGTYTSGTINVEVEARIV